MLFKIKELRERKEPLVFEMDFTDEELQLHDHFISLDGLARSELKVTLSNDQVRVTGMLKAELRLKCCRCLKWFQHPLQKDFNLEYWPDPLLEVEGEEFALTYTELVVGFYRNEELDLRNIISEQIVLDIPMKTICQEACKGLCDQCGNDLNEGTCDCVHEIADPRLMMLSDLKKKSGQTKMTNRG